MMKIGIHHRKDSFSEDWIEYCKKNGIAYKVVNCYESDIVQQLDDCNIFMWHFHHANPKDYLFAKQLIYSIQKSGKKVFPDFHTVWSFNDKIAQKYLLETIGIPFVSTYVFFEKEKALEWVKNAKFPKVFKLRNGAGSEHVRLVNSRRRAKKLISKAFSKGFSQYAAKTNLIERIRKFRLGDNSLWDLIKGFLRLGYTTDFDRIAGNEKGYIYFQDFIPNNDHDIRVVVIGEKAFAIKRMVRENDFRASGSGNIYMNRDLFCEELIKLAFKITEKLKSQCVAYDFIYDGDSPKIIEISYGFVTNEVPGYWDKDLKWHAGPVKPQEWMIENLLKSDVPA